MSFPFSITAPPHPQSISDWSLNPFCSLYCHPASKPSARLTWINRTASQLVFCSLLLIPTHLVVIPCLPPFHGLSLRPEIKPKLPVQVPRPLISCPSALPRWPASRHISLVSKASSFLWPQLTQCPLVGLLPPPTAPTHGWLLSPSRAWSRTLFLPSSTLSPSACPCSHVYFCLL